MSDHMPTIDEILARVRAETAAVAVEDTPPAGRRQGLGTIPLVQEPDDGEIIPLGRPFYTIEEFAALDDEDFLRNAYRVLLGRDMDGVGRSYYLPALRQGHISTVRVLSALSRSTEGKARGVKIRWLLPAAALDRLAGLPAIGKLFEPFMRFIVRSTTQRRLALLSERHATLIHEINGTLSAIRKNQALLDAGHMEIEKRTAVAEHRAVASLSEIRSIRQEIVAQRTALNSLIAEARARLPAEHQPAVTALEEASLDSLYVAFENRFRGSTSEILRRSERYLPIFRTNKPIAAGGVILDIGCGRGEFLSLLKRNNIATRGIDLNGAMVAEAKALDLDVLEGDAIAYLRSLPDHSLGAITGFHIVEHIGFKDLVSLFDIANRVLMPGGLVLFETPNPENLVVGACTFHYDPTHNKPLPPDYLRFVAEARGFTNARIIRKDEDCNLTQPESGFEPQEVNDWFRQPADYALYAQKPLAETAGDGQA
ncbi:methyltransferase domain-containing protein [Agrobacterium genomosp. 3]|uniref:methyltransferase domain-containing protein n=1 Tax=Agrobacterium tomkonis TaxID=1183410 RepID=UPI001CD81CA7|nr:methyltransferase domain-containing protein [Agrobacterium tomkonis]MCA1879518.1 methyltransferase domain-containing protein [Agrobacterium tumefaciens]MCA1894736.1 methyltransferase domain-containing protein [Agrobacterium tomkonis]